MRKMRDVLKTFAQSRQCQGNHIKPEVEILSEIALTYFFSDVFICRGDYSHVNFYVLAAAHSLKNLRFNHPEHFRLGLQGHIAYLIEEQCALVGQFELSVFPLSRSGERAFFVT